MLKNRKPVEGKKTEEVIEKKENMVKIKDINLAMEAIEQGWAKVLSAVKPYNHSVEAFLRAAKPKMVRGDRLIVEVFYPFHKDKLEEARNREIVCVEQGKRETAGDPKRYAGGKDQ